MTAAATKDWPGFFNALITRFQGDEFISRQAVGLAQKHGIVQVGGADGARSLSRALRPLMNRYSEYGYLHAEERMAPEGRMMHYRFLAGRKAETPRLHRTYDGRRVGA